MLDNTREIRISTEPATPKRRSWYLLTGLVIGIILGLVYAWLVNPVVYGDNAPVSLSIEDKDFYRSIIASVYASTGNFQRASMRLTLLEDSNPVYELGAQAQRALAVGKEQEAKALALLASSLQSTTQPIEVPVQPTPEAIPTHTLAVPTDIP